MNPHAFFRALIVILLVIGVGGYASPAAADPRTKQDIAFEPPASITLAQSPFALGATATSDLLVEYRSKTPSVCTVVGSSLALVEVGTCKLTATQPGDSAYMAAKAVSRSIEVSIAQQVITFEPVESLVMPDSTYQLSASATSGLPVSLAAGPSSVCILEGATTLLLRGPGSCEVTATQGGDWRYEPAVPVTRQIVVSLGSQVITFEPEGSVVMTESPVMLSAWAPSGLPVTFDSAPSSVCTNTDNVLTLVGPGSCDVTATQGGDWRYEPAVPVTRQIVVSLGSQVITFEPEGSVVMTESSVTLSASASSGLSVSFEAGPSSVCTVAGTSLTLEGAGSCEVTATQAGDWHYEPAVPVTRQIVVSLGSQVITFEPEGSVVMTESSVTLSASASSGLSVSFEAGPSSVCTSDGAELVLVGWGSCEVTATQAGDRRYEPAVPVTRWIAVLSGGPDAAGPTVSDVVVDPGSVTAPGSVSITWRTADASGVQWTNANVSGPGGQMVQCGSVTRTSGTVADSRWSLTCPIMGMAPNGIYTVWVSASDRVGNQRPRQFLGTGWEYDRTFGVSGGADDVAPPVVSDVVVLPDFVIAGDSVTITWRVADEWGVRWTMVNVTDPGGQMSVSCGMPTRTSGTDLDGEWSLTCPILGTTPRGTYTVWVSATDLVGNPRPRQFLGTSWEADSTFIVAS